MKKALTFDDVLIKPCFSNIKSRRDVDISTQLGSLSLDIPVISSNMETVTETMMSVAMQTHGGIGVLHRFCSIEDNISMVKEIHSFNRQVIGSVGIGDAEKDRALDLMLYTNYLCIDVAHGGQIGVVKQYDWLREKLYEKYGENYLIIIGNFATKQSIDDFLYHSKYNSFSNNTAIKVGIGPGSACTTRVKTGCGYPQLSAIIDCVQAKTSPKIIADGGMRSPGDIAKALAAGAHAVMLGGMFSGTLESPGEIKINENGQKYKIYRGSAAGGYASGYKTSEGIEFKVKFKGSVIPILKDIEGGLRSAFTYVGAHSISEFQDYAEFVECSSNTKYENGGHGEEH